MHGDYEVVDLKQGSDAWHQWRAGGIGASDSACLLGRDRFRSRDELIEEKLNPEIRREQNNAMRYGTRTEPLALSYYRSKRRSSASPACIESNIDPWMRASVDGLDIVRGTFVEIKCGPGTYKYVQRTRSIPEAAYIQMQHIMAISGFDIGEFLVFLPNKQPLLADVLRNEAAIEAIRKAAAELWSSIGDEVIAKLAKIQTSSTNRP